jgi:iron complex transport system ATP-binding protein
MRPFILEFQDVAFSYKGQGGLFQGLSFGLQEGAFVALLGPNGSGKSTLLKLACGFLRPGAGSIRLWGRDLRAYRPRDRAKLVSLMPQVPVQNLPFTVLEVVRMGLYPYLGGLSHRAETAGSLSPMEALQAVGLREKAHLALRSLSGGELRRAFIAMSLAQGAGFMLLDEPLANLDVRYQAELLQLLRGLNERGITVLMSLHDINMAFFFQEVMLLSEGTIKAFGAPEQVLREGLLREVYEVELDRKEGFFTAL